VAKQQFKKCLGIDIGTTSVKISECSYDKGTVRVNNLLYTDLPAFPDPEAAELGTAKIIKDLLKANRITVKEAVFGLSGQQVFHKRVKLPSSSEERLSRIINYEARQQIPFPPDKTRIEYQIFRTPGEEEVEVLMVAARRDHIENFMRMVERTGLKPIGLSVSSVSLFNYHSYLLDPTSELAPKKEKKPKIKTRGKKKAGKKGAAAPAEEAPEMELDEAPVEDSGIEEARALLNIGESYTDLIIAKKAKNTSLAFMRSIPIAGREFSRFIQNKVGIDSFEEAERLKREACVVFPQDGPTPDNPNIDLSASSALSEIIETRLSRQIQLSLDFFIAQPDGMAVDSMVLSGGSAILPGIGEVLSNSLNIPVEELTEPQSPALLMNMTPPRAFGNFGIAVGQAIFGLGLGRVQINFLPERFLTSLVFPRFEVAFLAVLLVVMIALATQIGDKAAEIRRTKGAEYEAKVQSLKPQQAQITEAETAREVLSNKIQKFTRSFDVYRRATLLKFYAQLTATIPKVAANTQLTHLDITPFGDVTIQGRSTDSVAAPNIQEALAKSMPEFIDPSVPPQMDLNERDANNNYSFRISAKLRDRGSRISTPTPVPAAPGSNPAAGGATNRPRSGGGLRPG